MLTTVLLGKYISVQGIFERALENGRIVVRVGTRNFVGTPV